MESLNLKNSKKVFSLSLSLTEEVYIFPILKEMMPMQMPVPMAHRAKSVSHKTYHTYHTYIRTGDRVIYSQHETQKRHNMKVISTYLPTEKG